MPIKFPCPHCKQSLSIRDELAGKTGRCPRCQQTITVPAAGAAPAAEPPPEPLKAPAPARPPGAQAAGAARTAPAKTAAPPPSQVPPKRAPAESKPSPDSSTPSPVDHPPAQRDPHLSGSPAPGANVPGSPEDIEAEAAALFSDKAEEAAAAPVTVDFNCPFCDTALHLPAELAGKKSPCPNPECRRIIKVPELTRADPKDWRKADIARPSLAKVDAGPAPEGAWGSTEARLASGQALVEAGVIQKRQKPRTVVQKLFWPVVSGTVVLLLAGGGWGWYSWWVHNREARALAAVEKDAADDAFRQKAGVAGQAALYLGVGDYYLRTGKPGCAIQARDHYGKALAMLSQGSANNERDVVLAELALAVLELGGAGDDVQKELRIPWEATLKKVRETLSAMSNSEGRLDALRAACRRLLARGQAERVLPLAGQVFSSPEAEKAEAVAAVGLEFLAAGDTDRAGKAAEQALAFFNDKPPAVKPAVVALALALNKRPPRAGKSNDEKADHFVGEVEGLARQGKDASKKVAEQHKQHNLETHFRALVGIAAAAVDAQNSEAGAREVEAALKFLNDEIRNRRELAWVLIRLVDLGKRAGLAEDRLRALAEANPDTALRGRGQLVAFQARLAARRKEAVEDSAVEQAVPAGRLAQLQAFAALARHNTRRDPDWSKGVGGWEEPRQAFGWLGVVLGLQDRSKGE
jgi:hypothetical protein